MSKNEKLLLIIGIAGAIAMLSLTTWVIPAKGRKFAQLFQRAEYTFNLPNLLLAKMAQQESNYSPNVVSDAGAVGLMQIVPSWHPTVDATDPEASINYAGALMRKHFNRFRSWTKALAAYNAGPNKLAAEISTHGVNWLANMPEETQSYVARISNDVTVI